MFLFLQGPQPTKQCNIMVLQLRGSSHLTCCKKQGSSHLTGPRAHCVPGGCRRPGTSVCSCRPNVVVAVRTATAERVTMQCGHVAWLALLACCAQPMLRRHCGLPRCSKSACQPHCLRRKQGETCVVWCVGAGPPSNAYVLEYIKTMSTAYTQKITKLGIGNTRN